jgi:hypothetical protein
MNAGGRRWLTMGGTTTDCCHRGTDGHRGCTEGRGLGGGGLVGWLVVGEGWLREGDGGVWVGIMGRVFEEM